MNRFRKMIRNIIKKQDGPIEPAKTPEEAQDAPATAQEVTATLDMSNEELKKLLRTLIQEEQTKNAPTASSIRTAKNKARNGITEGRTESHTKYFDSPRRGEGKGFKGARRVEKIREILTQDPYCTLSDLGAYFEVTRERVRQILVLNGIEKPHGRRARLSYVTATFSEGNLQKIIPPTEGLTTIPPALAAITLDNSHGIFDPDSPTFLGISLEQIHASKALIIVGHCGEGHKRISFSDAYASLDPRWRCFQCRPLYPWNFMGEDGKIKSKSQTKPCANCDKPVTKRAAILDRIINDPKYTSGDFFCSKKCFHNYRNYKSPKPWYTTSPVYQGHYWGNRPDIQQNCIICKKTFTTKSTIAKLCSDTCKKKRVEGRRKLRIAKIQNRAKQNNSGVVSDTLKKLRQEGVSMVYVANHLNVAYPTVYNWSRGYTPRNSKEITRQLKRLLTMTQRLS